MAIIAETEPSSNGEAEKTKRVYRFSKIKNHLNNLQKPFLASARLVSGRFSRVSESRQEQDVSLQSVLDRAISARDFIVDLSKVLFNASYLPHIAISVIAFIVVASNISDRVAAQDFYNQLIYVNPTVQSDIAESVDRYTDLIPNDPEQIKKAMSYITSADGFEAKNNPVTTEITSREVINPAFDNSAQTIEYVIADGDTLSGIGMKFNVKQLTLQYLNKINNADTLKPGTKMQIPPQGYEVSAAKIAKWRDQTKTRLAVSSTRNIITRNSSPGRSGEENGVGGYVGEIDSVKYVRKAKSNELQCYTYVTSQGYNVGGHLLAKWIPTNSERPKVGGLVVTYESWAGHVAVVIGVNGDGTFNIRESNYTHGWITERTMSVNSSNIKGFVN